VAASSPGSGGAGSAADRVVPVGRLLRVADGHRLGNSAAAARIDAHHPEFASRIEGS
jgi:hypothetical protein